MSNFIDNLLVVIRNKRVSRSEFARELNMLPQQLGYFLNRRGKPSFSTKKRICDVIGIPFATMEYGVVEIERKAKEPNDEYLPVQKRLATNLPYQMELKGISIAELSKRSGVCRSAISKYIKAEHNTPALPKIRALADALGISVGKLLN